jgi:hypothetical protein
MGSLLTFLPRLFSNYDLLSLHLLVARACPAKAVYLIADVRPTMVPFSLCVVISQVLGGGCFISLDSRARMIAVQGQSPMENDRK